MNVTQWQGRNPTSTPKITGKLHCAEIWGGFGNVDDDMRIGPVRVSLYSQAHESDRGGDIYYFSLCENSAIARVAIADVMGHGESVSAVSRWIYGALATKMNSVNGNEVLAELNELTNRVGLEAVTTAALLSFQADESSLNVSYAGHPPAWIRRSGENDWQPLVFPRTTALANVPLGLFSNATYHRERVRFEPGDRLFVYTDGLTEAASGSGEMLGEERLRSVLTAGADEDLLELKNRVLEAVRAHTGGTLGHDDVTLMVAEIA